MRAPPSVLRHLRAAILAVVAALAVRPAAADPPPASPPASPSASPSAPAAPRIGVRTADHPGYGRIVFDLPEGASASAARDGDRILVTLGAGRLAAAPPRLPRNVRAFAADPGHVAIDIAPGAGWQTARLGSRLVIDITDRPTAVPPAANPSRAATPAAARIAPHVADQEKFAGEPAPPRASAATAPAPPAVPPTPAPTPSATAPSATAPPAAAPPATAPPAAAPSPIAPPPAGPLALQASLLPADPAGAPGFALPFAARTGAAAFRRGAQAVLVFDEPRPIDAAALRADPSLAGLAVTVLPDATVLRLPLPPDRVPVLSRQPEGWTVRLAQADAAPRVWPAPATLVPRLAGDTLLLAAPASAPGPDPAPPPAGHVVTVTDAETGALLLVGTVRRAGLGVAAPRRAPRFLLLPTWQGVAVEPLADALALRAVPEGFALTASDGLALAGGPQAAALADAAALTRSFDLPPLPTDQLLRRMQARVTEAAAAPPLARFAPRLRAAEAMLALGLGPEAQAALALAARDDPRRADDPALHGLAAVAALVAGRPDEAGGLDDPRLAATDEIGFWRAVRLARGQEGAPAAAAAFAATAPLLLAYPAPLRARLLPLVAETLAAGGEIDTAAAVLARFPADPSLALARAMLAQTRGDTASALAAYDALDTQADRLIRMRALARAAELRLAAGALDAAGAAAALERGLIVWRGDARDLALRLRIAALRAQSGAWRAAFALLRETEAAFPDTPSVRARMRDLFASLLQDGHADALAPFEFVALAEENADLLPEGEAGEQVAGLLADRLLALDLPARAGPLLARLAERAPSAPARAQFGLRLAALRLGESDGAGALAALAASDATGLPPPLAERRAVLAARAEAQGGHLDAALARLAPLDGTEAAAARADLLEAAKDWPRASAALAALAARTVPAAGALDAAQRRTLLRLAAAAAQAGDDTTLALLRRRDLPRIGTGPDADLFGVLTEAPVRELPDLPRARAETQRALAAVAERR
jgi:hypothetical protein